MCSLIYDVHLWTIRDDSSKLPSTHETSCFKYADRSGSLGESSSLLLYSREKITYADEKKSSGLLNSKKPNKLKSGIREMENLLSESVVVFSKWRTPSFYQMVLSSGILLNVSINKEGDIGKLNIDKSLVGKLLDNIVSLDFNNKTLLATNNDSNVVLVRFKQPISFQSHSEPLYSLIDSIIHPDILSSSTKRSIRTVQLSKDSSFFVLWWRHSSNEVHPWSPSGLDEKNYNVLIYNLKAKEGLKHHSSFNSGSEPIFFEFRKNEELFYLGQDLYGSSSFRGNPSNGSNFLEYMILTNGAVKFKRKINISASVSCAGLCKDFVVLGFSNGNLEVFDLLTDQCEVSTKIPFAPCIIEVHPDGFMFLVSNKRGVLQCFDIALNPIRLWNGDNFESTGVVLDIGQYFTRGMTLESASWCPTICQKQSAVHHADFLYPNSILLRFQGGPLLLLRIFNGVYNNTGRSIQPLHLTNEYLKVKNYAGILRLLRLLNWSSDGHSILVSLNASFNAVLRTRRSDDIIEDLLSLFYNPRIPIPAHVAEDYSEQIRDLSRRYFHHLLRRGRTGKAFQLAVDIEDYDLFMDLYHVSNKYNYSDIADAALVKAHSIYEAESLEGNCLKSEGNIVRTPIDDLHFQPQLNATYTKTTAAKLISTMYYHQERSEGSQTQEGVDSIKVINFGAV